MMHRTEAQELAQIRVAIRGAERQTGIYEPVELIKMALEKHGKGKVAVSWSGGRCSTAVLFMALEIDPEIKVIHNDTGVLYPETSGFVKSIAKQYNINLTIVKPPTTFWGVCKQYGFPFEVRRGKGEPACCRLLKKYPTKRALKEQGVEAEITGIRVGEASNRMFIVAQRGQFYFAKSWGVWKFHPIALWTTNQLINFLKENSTPVNPVYDKYNLDREGCWPCTGYKGWKEVMARTNPKFYAFMMKQMGPQRILEHFYHTRIDPPCKTEKILGG